MSNFKLQTMKTIKLLAVLFISSLAFVSCSSDDDGHGHDDHEEEITQLTYTLTNSNNASDIITCTYTDADGEGGAPGVTVVSGDLTPNATYTGSISLMNLEEMEDVGAEIAANEAEEHEIFYITNVAGTTFTTTDTDANGNPLGFNTTVSTGAAGSGTLTISVIHEGKKPNDGTITDATSTGGTSDIDVSFNITVGS